MLSLRSIAFSIVSGLLLGAIPPASVQADGRYGFHHGWWQKPPPPRAPTEFWLTVLHNNDGESQLIDAGSGLEDFGGVARFTTLVHKLKFEGLRRESRHEAAGVVMLSSGDNFLAGPEFNASLDRGERFYDTIGMELIGYDACAIGNHEFDFGPEVLEEFIGGFRRRVPFVSANLDFSAEPGLQRLVEKRRIAPSVVLQKSGRLIGIVGATTPKLPFISSPRNTMVDPDVAAAIQKEVDALTARGVKIIIVISHLQSLLEDLELAPMLRDVDIMIGGGGDELLANEGDLLIPGDEAQVYGSYPIWSQDAQGKDLPIITTSGAYRYVGRLVAGFDRHGRLRAIDEAKSGPVRVAGGDEPDAVRPSWLAERFVTQPVSAFVENLGAAEIAVSEIDLDGRRSSVRTVESNQGDLIADALLSEATRLAPAYGMPLPQVALQNGGGIRNDAVVPAGPITELDTFDMLPFANFLCVVPDVPAAQFKEILENAVSRRVNVDGRFAQIAGFSVRYDTNGVAQVLDASGTVTTPGTRVVDVTLDDGTPIVTGGVVEAGAPHITVATIDFLARGGDQYPFRGASFTTLGVTYQLALVNYIGSTLGGTITAADYPIEGLGRITFAP